ncbi:putative transcriptional regulator [Pedobacter africanus]|uniref:Transcriptional regulator n=1 Tax=Pedobacter africanus TaxID=151894 RepID=A0ACC6KST2_9SPHI|nr:hypothetical protein [Pedobacter africanus]MDR6782413.1 putative transcriptional regulator [Pedobacter africanus]
MNSNKGDIIERIVRTKIGISELSRILHVSRTSIYNWFEHGHLNLETICKIGQAIGHDFANEFPEEFAKAKIQTSREFIDSKDFKNNSSENSVHFWMNKYIVLLEKFNQLLTEIAERDAKADLKTIDSPSYNEYNGDLDDHFDRRDHSLSCI